MKEYIVRCETSKITVDGEIVRCKDCEFCIVEEPISRGIIPDMYCRIWQSSVSTDDFCSYGERKEKVQLSQETPTNSKMETVETSTCNQLATNLQHDCKLESDLISRQAAIEALTGWQTDPTDEEIMRTLKALPPVEPPKKVVAQIKIDVEEIVERIKEEYEITEKPVCEDAIRCYEFLKERIGSETTDNAEEFEKWFERMVWHVQKCNEHDTEMRNVSEDAISKHDLWRIIEDNAYWITYNETSREKGMTLTGINQALNECPPVKPERPKGKWGDHGECPFCSYLRQWENDRFCGNCGADMRKAMRSVPSATV